MSQPCSPNAGLQLRRAISIQAEGKRLLKRHDRAFSGKALLNAVSIWGHLPQARRQLETRTR